MIELLILGGAELRRDGVDVRSVLSQPRRLALLAYLRLSAPGGFVSRDRLLALLWPESDDEKARNALRQSLHFLRQSLGQDVVTNRSDQAVGIDPRRMTCDAADFLEALAGDRLEEALTLYRGDLLSGFHVDNAPDMERWIEEKRRDLAHRAVEAARALMDRSEARDEMGIAALWARRLVALDPLSESGVRRFMTLLARTGERARALEAFEELERRLDEELQMAPSPETLALVQRIRDGEIGDLPTASPAAVSSDEPATSIEAATPVESTSWAEPAVPTGSASPSGAGHVYTAPEGKPAMPAVGTPVRTRRSLIARVFLMAAAALAIALAVTLVPHLRESTPGLSDRDPSIAVLPFVNMSREGVEGEYFSDGVTEELLNVLARVPGLRVAARTSSFAYRGAPATADSIGRALGVTHLLEGSVRMEGERVRITVQLIETEGGFHLWSETFERRLEDIFALQDEISEAVADRLQIQLAGEPPRRRGGRTAVDPVAHELYLRALHAWNRRTASSIRSAIEYFEEAVSIEPAYAPAWAGLAKAFVTFPQYAGLAQEPWQARAEEAAERALTLDPSLAEAHAALGLRHTFEPSDEAEGHYREALRLNPNYATAHHWYSIYFAERGRFEDQLREILVARSLDPLSPIIQLNVGKALFHLRRFDESVAAYRDLVDMEPGFGPGHALLAEALSAAGRHEEASAAAYRALDILGEEANPESLAGAGFALARAGHREDALRIVPRLEGQAGIPGARPGAWALAQLYAGLGQTEEALRWMEAALDTGQWGARPDLPFFDSLRGDERFRELARRFDLRLQGGEG